MSNEVKPQLHQSHLQELYRCGYKFERKILKGDREPPTTPLIVGTSTHLTTAQDLENKMEKGVLLPKEAVEDYARDNFVKTWQGSPVVLSSQEKYDGLEKTKGFLQDMTIQLSKVYHWDIATFVKPIGVEQKWILKTDDSIAFDLSGTIDVYEKYLTESGEIIALRDTKTRKNNTGQKDVDTSEQYTMYALYMYVKEGRLPDLIWQDSLIKPTAKRMARAVSHCSNRTQADFQVLINRINQAQKVIEAGAFTPANPSDWWCTKEFCGFAADGSCPYFNTGRKHKKPIKKETKNVYERREETIDTLSKLCADSDD